MDGRPLPGSGAPRERASARVARRRFAPGLCFILTLALVLLVPAVAAAATPGTVTWSHTWNASATGVVDDVQAVEAPGGGLYVAATVRRSGGLDIVLQRYTPSGTRRWVRWYDGPAHGADRVAGIAAGPNGSVTLCGATTVRGTGQDWIVLRYASDGTRRWAKRLTGDGSRTDRAVDVVVDASGNAVVAGTLTRSATGVDWCLAEFAPNGFRRWRTLMSTDGLRDDRPAAVTLMSSGRIAVAGEFSTKTRGIDAVLAGFTPKGRLAWRHIVQGLADSEDSFLAVAAGGGRVAAAGEMHGAIGGGDGLVMSCAADGSARWDKAIDGGAEPAGADSYRSVAMDGAGNVIVGGVATITAASGADAFVARLAAADGSQTASWSQDEGNGDAVAVVRLLDGDVFAAGRLGTAGAPSALVAGLDGDLAALWPALALSGAEATSIAPADGAIYIAGIKGADLLLAKVVR